jgi:serine/threonine protein kinase
MRTPAEKLEGHRLDGGWHVKSIIPKDSQHTGGYFSLGYIVESKEGDVAFLKALDIRKVISSSSDRITKMRDLTAAYVYERDLLRQCKKANLKRIIRLLDDGEIMIENEMVPYIIFEIAHGDVRKQANYLNRFEVTWSLRTMHHVAVGIKQLHGQEISHQDIKPSNILITKGDVRKIGDLGRSATRNCTLKHMDNCFAGDYHYAPPEALYGYIAPEWRDRRSGSDCYQLGSLFVFMLTGYSMTVLLVNALDNKLQPNQWGGSYQEILPYLVEAYIGCLELVQTYIPDVVVKDELLEIIRQLCHPDINQRGDFVKRRNGANPFDMERFISKFDRLATGFERSLYKMSSK